MLARILCSAVIGIEAYIVEVEVDIASGLPAFTTVGLPEAAVKESRERVKSAILNSGYRFPDDRITVNLAPANIKKDGTGFDLPIAVGLLAATHALDPKELGRYLILGELSLDGRVKPVAGSLPMALAARQAGYANIIVPCENAREARQKPCHKSLSIFRTAPPSKPLRPTGRLYLKRRRRRNPTFPTWSARNMPKGPWKWRPQAATTSS